MRRRQFNPANKRKTHRSGFTLIEVLVAMSVFAFVSITVYSSLSYTTMMRERLHHRYTKLAELQRVLAYVERDLLQIVARPTKSPFGDIEPALKLIKTNDMTFTRTGGERAVLTGNQQSSLLRLQYIVKEGALFRVVHSVLDGAQDSKNYPHRLATGLTKFKVQTLHDNRWHDDWPLPDSPKSPKSLSALPTMLKISIESAEGYVLSRTIVLHESKNIAT